MAINLNNYKDPNGNIQVSKKLVEDITTDLNTNTTKAQNLPTDGSFNPTSNIGKTAGLTTPLTLTQVSALPIGWAGLIKIAAMSSTAMYNGTKLSASDSGSNSIWLLINTASNQASIVGFNLSSVYLNISI